MNVTATNTTEGICQQFARAVVCGDLLHTLALTALVVLVGLLLVTATIFYWCWGRGKANWRVQYYRDLKNRDREKRTEEKKRIHAAREAFAPVYKVDSKLQDSLRFKRRQVVAVETARGTYWVGVDPPLVTTPAAAV